MPVDHDYDKPEPTRSEVERLGGATVLEFGASWCGYCRAAQPILISAFEEYPAVRHLKIGDASGRPLGRSFGIKLWPTLVFLKDGKEIARVVRPTEEKQIRQGLEAALR